MNGDGLQSSFWLMVALQTIGSVDMPGTGSRKLPAPRQYVAIIVAWSVLQLFADSGKDRAAGAVGWTLVATGAVLGPFGKRAVDFLNHVAKQFTIPPGTGKTASTPTPAQPPTAIA